MSDKLGEALSSARRSAGKTIADMESATRIRGRMINALEKGEYDMLPAPAYVRGYIISYAKFLGIDPEPLLKQFAEESGEASREAMRLPEQVVPRRHETHALPYQAGVIIVAGIIVVALAVWGIGRLTGGDTETVPLPPVPEATSTVEPGITESTAAVVSSESLDPAEVSPSELGDPFTLTVEIAQDGASWLKVTVDGLIAYEGTLAGGQSKEWEVTDSATLRVGKPTAVTVLRDGTAVEIPLNANTPEMTLSVTDAQE